MLNNNLIVLALIGCLLVTGACGSEKRPITGAKFVGSWRGEGRIIVAWCRQKSLSFDLEIDRQGKVRGKIGDARIQDGKFRLNKIFYRLLGNRQYIVNASLNGDLIGFENIGRDSIRIFLDEEDHTLVGGFHTSGSKFGGKEKMILSGTDIKLTKTP